MVTAKILTKNSAAGIIFIGFQEEIVTKDMKSYEYSSWESQQKIFNNGFPRDLTPELT